MFRVAKRRHMIDHVLVKRPGPTDQDDHARCGCRHLALDQLSINSAEVHAFSVTRFWLVLRIFLREKRWRRRVNVLCREQFPPFFDNRLFRNYILSQGTTRTKNSLFSRPWFLVKHVNACALIAMLTEWLPVPVVNQERLCSNDYSRLKNGFFADTAAWSLW